MVQFGHDVLKTWSKLDKDKKNYIIEQIKQEYIPAGEVVSNDWIKEVMVSCMSHKRSEARDAYGEEKEKPTWLDAEEWRQIAQEKAENPDKFWQQREAARVKNESVGSSHLGSGGYETLQEDFVSLFNVIVKYIIYAYTICTNINFIFWTEDCGRT